MSANLVPILARASKRGLGLSTLAALIHIAETPGTKLSTLATILGVSSAAVTGFADRLDDQNLARRRPMPNDRRAHSLEITDAGRAVLAKILS